jgi:glycosyltransferase involved in cell wall biosynthesis
VKTLTVIVPCYNSADYLARCLDSLVPGADDVEIVVVDDGSTDATAMIAEEYAARFPGVVRAIHQANGGHGSAINAGVRDAAGRYVKIVDSDDWLDARAYRRLVATLRHLASHGEDVDAVVSNFVYEKDGKRRRRAVRYRGALPRARVFGWEEVGEFGWSQYLLMHSLVYRTGLLRECGLSLPEHTYYVDNVYAYVPLARVRRLYYLDVDLYRYHIGRADQSVNEAVMCGRIDQYLRINRLMVSHLGEVLADPRVPQPLRRYLLHYAKIVCATASVLLARTRTEAAQAGNERFWTDLSRENPSLFLDLRRGIVCRLANQPSGPARLICALAYSVTKRVIGFS